MKKRIGGLEGEARTARGLRTSLEKNVKILEIALKKEREKVKGLSKGEAVDVSRDPKDAAREELKSAGKGDAPFLLFLLLLLLLLLLLPRASLLTQTRFALQRNQPLRLGNRSGKPPLSGHPSRKRARQVERLPWKVLQ